MFIYVIYMLAVLTISAAAGFLFGAVLALITGGNPVVMGTLCAVAVLGGIAWAGARYNGD